MGEVPSELAPEASRSIAEPAPVNLRHFDVFIETTTQMLATPRLQERRLLALEAIVHNFGCRQAAIAIVNEREAELRMRAALGFGDDHAAARVEMPLDSAANCVRVIHDAQPVWIALDDDESSRQFLGKMNWRGEVLAFPLFGIAELPPNTGRERTRRLPGQYWTFERGSRVGVLYVGTD